ncbi:MAG TPA: hypothetical protein VGO03_18055 [Acidimicrobiia bacterium]
MGISWSEWRAEQEQAALDAAFVRRHGLGVRDRLRDAMARGDRIWLWSGGIRLVGEVVEVDTDLVSLRDGSVRHDVRLDPLPHLAMGVIEGAAGSGRTPPLSSGGFRGRLLAAETSDADHLVMVSGGEAFEGRILVGLDHVDVVSRAAAAITVTLAMVVALRRADDSISPSRRSAPR